MYTADCDCVGNVLELVIQSTFVQICGAYPDKRNCFTYKGGTLGIIAFTFFNQDNVLENVLNSYIAYNYKL